MSDGFQLLPEQASNFAVEMDALALYLLAFSVFFTLLVMFLVATFALRYRRRSDDFDSPNPPAIEGNLPLEIAWSVIPLLLTLVMFVWGTRLYIAQSRPPQGAMEIHVIGKQWMWKIEHPDGRREIDELTVPVDTPVKLVMTSQDVIHSFGIPAFRITQDVLPGRYSYEWFTATKPGVYHLFCREYCGTNHSGMIGHVRVLTRPEYDRWLAAQPIEGEAPEVAGARLFQKLSCITCHGVRAPSLGGVYGSKVQVIVDGQERTVTADYEYLRESILYPRAKIVKGFPADLMPSFQGQVTEEQLMQLIAYIKSLGGTPGQPFEPGTKMQDLNPPPPQLHTDLSGAGNPSTDQHR